MDKLELDDRVSRLEQRMSVLTALLFGILVLFGVSVTFLLFAAQGVNQASATLTPPTTTVYETTVATPEPPHGPRDNAEGGVAYLIKQLRDVSELQHKGLLTSSEAQARKNQLLARPLRTGDLRDDLEQVAELQKTDALTSSENQALRAKVLEAGK